MNPLFPYFNLNLQMFAAQQQAQKNELEVNGDDKKFENDINFAENLSTNQTQVPKFPSRTKRKGKAFKLKEKLEHSDEDPESGDNLVSRVTSSEVVMSEVSSDDYECRFCGIIFRDNVLFSLHNGYHSRGDDPFICNMCGMKTDDKIQFFLHIAKFPHS